MTVSFTSGVAYPGDLTALQRIYDDVCDDHGFCHGSPAAEDLARATMDLFSQGILDQDEMIESLEIYLERKSGGR
ncbi:hypothetical protein ACFWXH_28935 [Mesorhizobium sp. NPDC059054]|uniref:hypothetical protein n=1 Tax=unclassified Mesorhizobium TaxID=325217 RepID=UPI000AF95151|nr:hypothetical protein [Mesorhizobium sp. 1M-11]